MESATMRVNFLNLYEINLYKSDISIRNRDEFRTAVTSKIRL